MTLSAQHPARVLLVEDSETQALQIRHRLERDGFAVDFAPSAEAALESLNGTLPDIVVSDYHLPGMNGDELSRQIRLNGRTRTIPVLMLTEAQERALERQGLESGADAYVAKSADWDLIVLRMKALLRPRVGTASTETPFATPIGSAAFTTFRRAHVLVADSSATYRAYLHALLREEGYSVHSAASAEDALARAAELGTGLDCAILNVAATGFDSTDLCRALSARRNFAASGGVETPSFLIVGIGSETMTAPDAMAEAFAAGIDDIVPSDMDEEGLRLRIRTLVRRKLLQEESRRIEAELRERELAMERARAAAAEAEVRASFAEQLKLANTQLASTNRKLKDTQSKLVQAAKMASLGELVAGIAHEINNPLAFILAHQGTVERLLGDIEAKRATPDALDKPIAKARERLDSMRMGMRRIQDLVLNLRRFSRLDEGEFQTVNVQESIETVLALLAHKLTDRIRVERHYDAVDELYCSPALLNQVVMNIVGNAADAIPGDGTIVIQTNSDADSYSIDIGDSGPGIPEHLRERVFEPFFTTKPVGSGTGLGLSIAYSIVEAHHGNISIGEGPLGGACFSIVIPLRPSA